MIKSTRRDSNRIVLMTSNIMAPITSNCGYGLQRLQAIVMPSAVGSMHTSTRVSANTVAFSRRTAFVDALPARGPRQLVQLKVGLVRLVFTQGA